MARFLNIYAAFNVAVAAVSLGMGYLASAGAYGVEGHFLAGLFAVLSCILWAAIVMFYFIYTGSAIKRTAAAKLIADSDYRATRRFKSSVFPWLIAVIALFTVIPYLGLAAFVGQLPEWGHHAAVWAALIVFAHTARKTGLALGENEKILMNAVEAVDTEIERRKARRG